MIIPIGHDQTTVRRLPWVTFTIMAVCVAAFLYTNAAAGGNPQQRFDDVAAYFLEHPYLELPQELENALWGRGAPTEDQAEAATEAVRSFGGEQWASPRRRELEQRHLDELVALFEDALVPRPLREHGLVPAQLEVTDLVTHMFLHAGWLHLLGNLFFLYLAGPFIEDVWGRPLFLGFYLLGGVVAGGLYALRYPLLEVPLIGASGAIAAVMGAFLVRYFSINIRFFYWFGLIWRGTFDAPAWLMLPLWFARELVFAQGMDVIAPAAGGSGVAYWAHVWGFAFGAVVAVVLRQARIEERYLSPAIERKVTVVDNTVLAEAMALRDDGRHDQALAILRSEVRRDPLDPDVVNSFWTVAAEAGCAAEAAPFLLRLIREHLRSGEEELAVASWWDLRRAAAEAAPDLQLALRIAEWLRLQERIADAREVVRDAVEHLDGGTPAALLARLARLGEAVGAGEAAAAAAFAVRHPETPPEVRAELAALAAQAPPPGPEARDARVPPPHDPVPPPSAPPPAAAGHDWAPPAAAGWSGQEAGGGAAWRDDGLAGEPDVDPAAAVAAEEGPVELSAPPAGRTLRVMEVVPEKLGPGRLLITADGVPRTLDLAQVAAVAVAGIRPADGRSFLVLDLLLDAPWSDAPELRLVRLSSTRFDPRALVPAAPSAVDAFRGLVAELLHGSGGVPLPDPDAAAGNPFRLFAGLAEYELEVFGAAEAGGAATVAAR